MLRLSRSACALLTCAAILTGCGGTGREDRTISFSTRGDNVGFQHGREGVFVADRQGGGLTKVFTPDKDVIAVGTPLWAPNDRRLLFTTARPLAGGGIPAVLPQSLDDPAGRLFVKQAATYTCWLRDQPRPDENPESHALFTADVDHVGYVAAGLAARWHPAGDRILYVKQCGPGHAVFEFDIASGASHRVFPITDSAEAVAFDWTPDASHLVCVLVGMPDATQDGIWIGRGGAEWWHVRESAPVDGAASALDRVKAARPAWTRDGRRFAFAQGHPGAGPQEAGRHALWLGTLDGQRVQKLLEEPQPMHDLVWHPDGERLGFISGLDAGPLKIVDLKQTITTVTTVPVRGFAGWDATGQHLAYTSAGAIAHKDDAGHALLFFPDPQARDVLRVAPGDGKNAGRIVASGLRTTFLHWSPTDERLSLWFTFSPTHRALFSADFGGGLRPGDPAAVIEAATGKIGWMAVSADEKAQLGHYYLLKRDYAEAWRWYEQAARERGAAGPGSEEPSRPWGFVQMRPFRDVSLFEYYCLDKLGRKDDARARLADFRRKARQLLPSDEDLKTSELGNANPALLAALQADVRSLVPLARDFYTAEVFLSLDAAADGEAFLRKALSEAANDEDRLSAAIVLAQLLLLQGRTDDYVDVLSTKLAPVVAKAVRASAADERFPPIPIVLAWLTTVPLGMDDVLAKASDRRVEAWLKACLDFRKQVADDGIRQVTDVMLEAAYKRLGRDKEREEVRQRLSSRPGTNGMRWQDSSAAAVALMRDGQMRTQLPQVRQVLQQGGLPGLLLLRHLSR
jgi:hypothetical protein